MANNVVFAGGKFTAARPPGVAVGGAGSVTANNFFAYDITTGNRVAAHSHSMNGQVLAVSASPDGSRVYVGGDFTTVDGVARNHIVAFDTATGAVVTTFRASVSGQVRAISATDSTVYVGGNFFSANGSTRRRLAAFNASAATQATAILPWAPTADDNKVSAMVVSPDKSRVIVGGSFTTINGAPAQRHGLGRRGHRCRPAVGCEPAAAQRWNRKCHQQPQDGRSEHLRFGLRLRDRSVRGRLRGRRRAQASSSGPTTATATPTT